VKWLAKAALQKTLSALPASETANYVFQRKVLKTLPVGDEAFRTKFKRALGHFETFLEHGPRRTPSEAVFYEFGTGWDLVVPLSYYCLGVERHVLVDIRPNARLELVNDSVRRLGSRLQELEAEAERPLRPPGEPKLTSLAELEERFGISYLAPRDARATGLPPDSVDFVSSTATLEHIPTPDVLAILTECNRLLRADGAMSCRIDMRDHHSYFDTSVSPYNFLKFSDRAWSLLNSALMYQNRLRHPDYLRLFEEAGFDVVAEQVARPTERDVEALRRLRLAPSFRDRYSVDELGAKSLVIVARPAEVAAVSPDAREELADLGRRGRSRVGLRSRPDGDGVGDLG
jgi:SAM-dependent methyltransferase